MTEAKPESPPKLGEVRALTGLRGIAAFIVALDHITDFLCDQSVSYRYWVVFAFVSLPLFFCLSALTLSLVYGAGSGRLLSLRNFAVARFARVYPLALAALLVSGPYFLMWNGWHDAGGRTLIFSGLRQLFLVNHWPLIGTGEEWVAPLWSLSVEVFCYIFIFPLLFWMAAPVGRQSFNKLLGAMLVIVCLTFICEAHSVRNGQPMVLRQNGSAGGMFILGWLAYLLYRFHRPDWLWMAKRTDVIYFVALLIMFGRGALTLTPFKHSDFINLVEVLLFFAAPLLVMVLLYPDTRTARFLSLPPLHFLGEISYSLYVWHVPVKSFIEGYYQSVLHHPKDIPYAILVLVASIGVATLSYYFFECPARDFIRRHFMRRAPARVV